MSNIRSFLAVSFRFVSLPIDYFRFFFLFFFFSKFTVVIEINLIILYILYLTVIIGSIKNFFSVSYFNAAALSYLFFFSVVPTKIFNNLLLKKTHNRTSLYIECAFFDFSIFRFVYCCYYTYYNKKETKFQFNIFCFAVVVIIIVDMKCWKKL